MRINSINFEESIRKPASKQQCGIWKNDQLSSDKSSLVSARIYTITGNLIPELFLRCISQVVYRHYSLRTIFIEKKGCLYQCILNTYDLTNQLMDFSSQEYSNIDSQINQHIAKTVAQGFDLSSEIPVRFFLYQKSICEYVFAFIKHDIACDGSSVGVIYKDIERLYKNPELMKDFCPTHFTDDEEDSIDETEKKQQSDYWKFLSNLSAARWDITKKANKYKTAEESIIINKSLIEQSVAFTKEQGCTFFAYQLALIAMIIHKYTGLKKISIGSPFSNRVDIDKQHMVGCLSYNIVYVIEIEENDTIVNVLQKSMNSIIDSFSNSNFKTESIIETLNPKRSEFPSWPFHTFFAPQEDYFHEFKLGDFKVERLNYTFSSNDDLNFLRPEFYIFTYDIDGNKQIIYKYNTYVFSKSKILRMLQHFKATMEWIIKHPKSNVKQLNILPDDEYQELVYTFNNNKLDYDKEFCLHQRFENIAKQYPSNIAIIERNQNYTYEDVNNRANQLATYLMEYGIAPKDRVGLLLEPSVDFSTAILSINKLGATCVPMNSDIPHERLGYIIEEANIKILIVNANFRGSSFQKTININNIDLKMYSEDNLSYLGSAFDLAFIFYTSGSTGMPKGVAITNRAAASGQVPETVPYKLMAENRLLFLAPVESVRIIGEFFWTWFAGATVVIPKKDAIKDIPYLLKFIRVNKITLFNVIPSILNIMLDEIREEQYPYLEKVFCLGEILTLELMQKFKRVLASTQIINSYGQTEACPVSFWEYTSDYFDSQAPIGKPITNVFLYILDDNLMPVPKGFPGILYVGGSVVSEYYINAPNNNDQRYFTNPFTNDNTRLFKTNDIVVFADDGNILFIGRKDNMLKINGIRIEPEEIEVHLKQYPMFKEVAIIGYNTDQNNNAKLAMCVILKTGFTEEDFNFRNFRGFLEEKLPEYMIPRYISFFNELPKTENGKIDRKSIVISNAKNTENMAYEKPRNNNEQIIFDVVTQILDVNHIGIYDNLFEFRCDSLQLIKIITEVKNRLNRELDIGKCFYDSSVFGIASAIEEKT